MVEVAALVHQRLLFLGLGAHSGLSGLSSAGPRIPPAHTPTRFPASRLGCTDSVALFRGRLIEEALGLRVRVKIHLLWSPGLARKGTFSHRRRRRAGGSAAETGRRSPHRVAVQWVVAQTAAVFLHSVWMGIVGRSQQSRGPLRVQGLSAQIATFSGSTFPPTACCRGWPASF